MQPTRASGTLGRSSPQSGKKPMQAAERKSESERPTRIDNVRTGLQTFRQFGATKFYSGQQNSDSRIPATGGTRLLSKQTRDKKRSTNRRKARIFSKNQSHHRTFTPRLNCSCFPCKSDAFYFCVINSLSRLSLIRGTLSYLIFGSYSTRWGAALKKGR